MQTIKIIVGDDETFRCSVKPHLNGLVADPTSGTCDFAFIAPGEALDEEHASWEPGTWQTDPDGSYYACVGLSAVSVGTYFCYCRIQALSQKVLRKVGVFRVDPA